MGHFVNNMRFKNCVDIRVKSFFLYGNICFPESPRQWEGQETLVSRRISSLYIIMMVALHMYSIYFQLIEKEGT